MRTKIESVESRYPQLRQQMIAMFQECWPTPVVRHMIETHYGVHFGLRTINRYKQQHWEQQRALVTTALARRELLPGELCQRLADALKCGGAVV